MEYEVRKKKLYTQYRHVNWASGAPYWISNAKHSEPSDPITKLHYHNMYEAGMCVEGCGEYQINDKIYHFKAGDIVFINHFTPHYSNSQIGAPAKWKIVFFDPIRLMQLAGMLDPDKALLTASFDIPFNGIFAPEEHPPLTEFIKEIIEQAEIKDEYTDINMAFSIGNFIIACTRYFKAHPNMAVQSTMSKNQYHNITPAISTINSHMANSAMIEEETLAGLCKMSVSNLRRLFKEYTGLSPKAYINNTRMAYAEYLLTNTNMTVLKISTEVGYSEVSGFNRIFKLTFGMSPSDYRKKAISD